jgi:hypothetical protein
MCQKCLRKILHALRLELRIMRVHKFGKTNHMELKVICGH